MSTVVAKEGNRRKGAMTRSDIEQCVLDINAWFAKYTDEGKLDTSEEDFETLEKAWGKPLPDVLDFLLTRKSGSEVWFMDKALINAAQSLKYFQKYRMDALPFAGNEDGMLVLDSKGQVCEWDLDDGVGDVVSNSLSAYLEYYRNFLLEGNCEFLSDVGVIEKMTKARK